MPEKPKAEKIILGIDPGSRVTGYGIIRVKGKAMELMTYGVIDISKIKDDHFGRLRKIFEKTLKVIEEYLPDEVAIEAPFYGKNIQSMLKLGRAQGVSMAAALYRDIPIFEYAPKKVKMAVTGNGNAGKEMVSRMLEKLLKFKFENKFSYDASDGIALAVCHFFQNAHGAASASGSKKKSNSWKNFLTENPGRLKKKL